MEVYGRPVRNTPSPLPVEIVVCNLGDGVQTRSLAVRGVARRLALSADGQILAIANSNEIVLWSVAEAQKRGQIEHVKPRHGFLALSHDDARIAVSGSPDKTMRLWDLSSGKEPFRFPEHPTGVHAAAITPNGRFALSGSGLRLIEGERSVPAAVDLQVRLDDLPRPDDRESRRVWRQTLAALSRLKLSAKTLAALLEVLDAREPRAEGGAGGE